MIYMIVEIVIKPLVIGSYSLIFILNSENDHALTFLLFSNFLIHNLKFYYIIRSILTFYTQHKI